MDDAGARETGLHIRSSNSLAYGHFGTATYDSSDQSWHFLREDNLFNGTQHVLDERGFGLVQGPNSHRPPILDVNNFANSRVTNRKESPNKFFLQHLPEVCAANEPAMSARSTHDSIHDELNGDAVAFGGALLRGANNQQSGAKLIPIMVTVHGVACDQVVFSCLSRQRVSFLDQSSGRVELDIPQISYANADVWELKGAVRHLAVSLRTSSPKPTRFAAVTQAGTSIFRPQLRSSGTARPLTANHIVDIPSLYTGGLPHVHASFHPNASEIIAVVDVEGNWSTWTVGGKNTTSTRSTHHARLLISGHLPHVDQNSSASKPSSYPIGWHRIYWLNSSEATTGYILICNKRAMYLFDIATKDLRSVALKAPKESTEVLILDVIIRGSVNSEVFVLTNSHLLWMSVNPPAQADTMDKDRLGNILSCNHFRSRTDPSLSIQLLERQGVIWIFLSSRVTKILTVYKAYGSTFTKCSMEQASLARLPLQNIQHSSQILFRDLQSDIQERSSDHPVPWLFKLLVRHHNGIIDETTFTTPPTPVAMQTSLPSDQIALPSSRTPYYQSTPFLDTNEDESFIVDDESLQLVDAGGRPTDDGDPLAPTSMSQDSRTNLLPSLESSYCNILKEMNQQTQRSKTDLETFLLAMAHSLYEEREFRQCQLLTELSATKPYIAEIEEDSALLSEFFDNVLAYAGQSPDIQKALVIGSVDNQKLMTRYESLVNEWMLPLSQAIPDRTRIFRERLARQVAFDLHLSKLFVRVQHYDHADDVEGNLGQPDEFLNISSMESDAKHNTAAMSSQSDATDGPSQNAAAPINASFLTSYVQFTKPLPDQTPSTTTMDILRHLPESIDEDPDKYSHYAVEAQLASARDERKYQHLDPRAKRKAEKVAKSRKRQLEKQEKVKKVAFDARSEIPLIASSQLPIRNVQSSQAAPLTSSQTEIPSIPTIQMSQPERGQFGGRPVKKGKRRAGF